MYKMFLEDALLGFIAFFSIVECGPLLILEDNVFSFV
jgi:hypothetical protein